MKHSILLSLLLFVCLGVFGKPSNGHQNARIDSLQNTVDSQQSTITTLHDSIRNLQMQMNNMKDKVDTYQKLVSDTTSNMHDDLSDFYSKMIGVLSLIGLVLGVAAPLYFNYRNEKNMENLLEGAKSEAANAKKQAKDAGDALIEIQSKVSEATNKATASSAQAENARTALVNFQKNAENIAKDTESAAKKAKAIQYFIQALQERDKERAIELYNKCIIEDKKIAEAYNNRGFLRHKIDADGTKKEALDDYNMAIELFKNQGRGIYAEAYNNRGILHFEQQELNEAENDFDAAISKDYAEAYLNRGLLKYKKNQFNEVEHDFNIAITKKSNFAEAIYIRGLWRYSYYLNGDEYAITDIIEAKSIKNDVAETLPIRSLLTEKMKTLDDSINGVEYSKDMTKLIRVLKDNIHSFIIPRFVTEVGDGSFFYSTNLKEIFVEENNPDYYSKDGNLYSKNMSKLIAVPAGKNSIEIFNDVSAIGDGAFAGCINLNSIKIPNNVIDIGYRAFFGCKNLTSIEIPESVIQIKDFAFQGCKSLSSIKIPKRVTKIGDAAFIDCTSLTSIEIPDSVTKIGDGAFYGCTNLTSITIPNAVAYIGHHAFYGCTNLSSIEFPKSVAFIGWNAFEGCTSLTTISIPEGLVEINDYTFRGCTQLTSIVIPDSVNKIGEHAFEGCTNLKEMHFKHTTPLDFVASLLFLNYYQVTIIVPRGSREAYQNSGLYMGFKNIIEEGEEQRGQAPSEEHA